MWDFTSTSSQNSLETNSIWESQVCWANVTQERLSAVGDTETFCKPAKVLLLQYVVWCCFNSKMLWAKLFQDQFSNFREGLWSGFLFYVFNWELKAVVFFINFLLSLTNIETNSEVGIGNDYQFS